jgi:hypothetical protein
MCETSGKYPTGAENTRDRTRLPAPSPCGKHSTDPARGETPCASTTPACSPAVKNVVQPPSKSSFRYSRNVSRERWPPHASYTYSDTGALGSVAAAAAVVGGRCADAGQAPSMCGR